MNEQFGFESINAKKMGEREEITISKKMMLNKQICELESNMQILAIQNLHITPKFLNFVHIHANFWSLRFRFQCQFKDTFA